MKHVMVDLETLGTTADAVIMSIGAVKFDLKTGEIDDSGFYASVSIESNLERGRRIAEDTLIWWLRQSPAAQQVFTEPKQVLADALVDFSDWVGADDYHVWSNGADFDIPMLAHAFTQVGVEVPWRFYNTRCFRSFKTLPGADKVPKPNTGTKHNALTDALNQAQHAVAIHKALFAPQAKKVKV